MAAFHASSDIEGATLELKQLENKVFSKSPSPRTTHLARALRQCVLCLISLLKLRQSLERRQIFG